VEGEGRRLRVHGGRGVRAERRRGPRGLAHEGAQRRRAAHRHVGRELRQELGGRREAEVELLLERGVDREDERSRRVRAQRAHRREVGVALPVDHLVQPAVAPRAVAGEHLPSHDREAVEVAPRVGGAAGDLLRRHVARRPGHRAVALHAAPGEPLDGDVEVGEQRPPVRGVEEDVLGLHVAVHHAARVRMLEGAGHVAQHHRRRLAGQAGGRAQHRAQRRSRYVLHHERQPAVGGGAQLVVPHDVGVVQPGHRRGLVRAARERRPVQRARAHDLHRDDRAVGVAARTVHRAARAAPHLLQEGVARRETGGGAGGVATVCGDGCHRERGTWLPRPYPARHGAGRRPVKDRLAPPRSSMPVCGYRP
jgi:hypothetical protein